MKISPLAGPTNTVQTTDPKPSQVSQIRKMRMETNATPLSMPPPEIQETEQKLTISDNIGAPEKADEVTNQPISPQYAALARQKRALQVKEREISERERALEAKSQGSDAVDFAKLKSDPLGTLQAAGVTYDDLTNAILGKQADPRIIVQEELKAHQEAMDKKLSERDQNERNFYRSMVRQDAEKLLSSDDPRFELAKKSNVIPDVVSLIEKTYDKEGRMMDAEEALEEIENYLFEQYKEMAAAKKLQNLFRSQEEASSPNQLQSKPGMRTLTNQHTASVPQSVRERALAAFYGNSKR